MSDCSKNNSSFCRCNYQNGINNPYQNRCNCGTGSCCLMGPTGPRGCPGPMGPAGPAGKPTSFDPLQTISYTQGQLITYNGVVYMVTKNNPSGTPGSSSDYITIAGPGGIVATSPFDPSKASSYVQGQLVTSGGIVYVVNKNNPTGTPGTSPDYTPVAGTGGVTGPTGPAGIQGATGPAGLAAATTFDPSQSSTYQPGQIVIGPDGKPYVVQTANPTGTPGSSSSYVLLTGAAGPTGATEAIIDPQQNPKTFFHNHITTFHFTKVKYGDMIVKSETEVNSCERTAKLNLSGNMPPTSKKK